MSEAMSDPSTTAAGGAMPVRDVIILGAGCAGWAAAIYAARGNLAPLVLCRGQDMYGQLGMTTDVENYPGFPEGILGPELMERFHKQAERFGAETRIEEVTAVDLDGRPILVTTRGGTYRTRSLIICTGSSPRKLGIPGEGQPPEGFWGTGVSSCATCDGAFYRDRVVAVVGGGDSAAEEATFLTRFASKVYLVHRRDRLRASDIMAQRVLDNPKIEVLWNTVVTEVVGDGVVTGMKLRNVETDETREQAIDGFFLAIGHDPNTGLFQGQLDLDDNAYLITDHFQRCLKDGEPVAGVFAGGDVQDHTWQQAITACGTGCASALAAEKYLEGLEGRPYPDERRQAIAEQVVEAQAAEESAEAAEVERAGE